MPTTAEKPAAEDAQPGAEVTPPAAAPPAPAAPPAEPEKPKRGGRKKKAEPELVDYEQAMGHDARARVPWAGLLADQPKLRDQQHTLEEWQELLDDYLASERI